MRTSRAWSALISCAFLAGIALGLSACNLGKVVATPTDPVNAIYTIAAQTLTAQDATQRALTPPLPVATQTLFPTLPPPSIGSPATPIATAITGGPANTGCDSSAYIGDVTIPDGTVLEPGKNFVKTWAMMNNGTCGWTLAYKLAFISGDSLGGTSVPVPENVPAGEQTKISVSLIAPTIPGDYKGFWQLVNPQGHAFGSIITVVITVGPVATPTATIGTPAASGTPTPSNTPTPTPTPTT